MPIDGTRLTDAYVKEIGRLAYFWAWPMVNIHNRMLTYSKLPSPGLAGGVLHRVAVAGTLAVIQDRFLIEIVYHQAKTSFTLWSPATSASISPNVL